MNNSDVTAEQTLRRALLTERLAAVGTLADGLAHEVHNPLNGALLQLAVLQRRLEQPDCGPASLQPVAGLVEEALRRLELLFNDLVSLLQPRSPERAPVAVGDRFPAVVTLLRAHSQAGKMRVALDVALEVAVVD